MTAKSTKPAAEALLTAARRFNQAGFSRSQALTNGELSRAEWHLMWLLQHWTDPKGARPSELARQQKVTAGNVAQLLRNLEQQSLVARTHDDADRRVVLVRLTSDGEIKLNRVRNEFVDQFERLVNNMGADESEHLIRLLMTAADYLEMKEPLKC